MLSRLSSLLKKIIYKSLEVRAFVVTRLLPEDIREKVFLLSNDFKLDISEHHGMICLDPFSVAIWLSPEQANSFDQSKAVLHFKKNNKVRSIMTLSLIDKIVEGKTVLLLYKTVRARCFQLNPLSRFLTLSYFLKNKTTTTQDRKFIASLYSYPRKIIIVSYKEDGYCNIFPMDIHGYIPESDLYILGLRTTNITLNKILANKKVVIADTDKADIRIVYSLGRHFSVSPPKIEDLPFKTSNSELFNFPVADFSSSYKEVEIFRNKEMGYHMLMVGRVLNFKKTIPNPSSLYHVHIFEFPGSGYTPVVNEGYS